MKIRWYMVADCLAVAGAFISWFYIPRDYRVWITAACLTVALVFWHLILWEKRPRPTPQPLPYGWLINISGGTAGTVHRLHRGNNFYGFDENGQLKILRDGESSERNYGYITFDMDQYRAILMPPECGIEIHLNNNGIVYRPQVLQIYDKIEIEGQSYIFLPLCGSHFSWSVPSAECGMGKDCYSPTDQKGLS